MNFSRALAASLSLLIGACVAPGDPQLGTETSAIVGGQDTTDQPAVIMSVAHQPGSMLATICTGVVISPHVVLTAAHCVSPANVGANAIFNLFEKENLNLASSADLLPVASVDFDPQYDAKNFSNGYDLGVVVSPNVLTPAPLPLNRKGLTKSLIGQAATLIGYGERGADLANTAGIKREVQSQLDGYDDKFGRFGMEGATACEGDSGGPALMTLDGVLKIVGVVSFGDPTCTQSVAYSRVDAYLPWIDSKVQAFDPGYFTDLSMPSHGGCELATSPSSTKLPWLLCLCALAGAVVLTRSRARGSR